MRELNLSHRLETKLYVSSGNEGVIIDQEDPSDTENRVVTITAPDIKSVILFLINAHREIYGTEVPGISQTDEE